jgi:Ca2+-binding EF-hand superfamily protein
MRHPAGASAPPLLLAVCLSVLSSARPAAAGVEQDQFEEKVVARAVERAAKTLKTDRTMWVRELEAAFPGKVTEATTEAEYVTWFGLVAGEGEEWRREATTTPGLAELYGRVVRRLELGPVPSITRGEFTQYVRKILMREAKQAAEAAPDPVADADSVFRVLDRDGDGILKPEEMTTKLREDGVRADTDANGRIDKDEYRRYFARRVTVAVETATAAATGGRTAPKAADREKDGDALPGWFADLDPDGEGQVALYQWRKSGRSIEAFEEMDLNGDGLLTPDEYQRFQRMKAKRPQTPPPG